MKVVLRPGYLVALATRVDGGINYDRRDLGERTASNGAEISKWETTRKIEDKDDYERAQKVRSKASALIRSACAQTSFGLVCSESGEDNLNRAIAEAEALIRTVNGELKHSRITVRCLIGKIADSDVAAARAISGEVQSMIEAMERGIANADPEAIREAAKATRELGKVLAPEQAAKVNDAVKAARAAARTVMKRVKKEGESAAEVLKDLATEKSIVSSARLAFLDLDMPEEESVAALPSVSMQRMAELDLESDDDEDSATDAPASEPDALAASAS